MDIRITFHVTDDALHTAIRENSKQGRGLDAVVAQIARALPQGIVPAVYAGDWLGTYDVETVERK